MTLPQFEPGSIVESDEGEIGRGEELSESMKEGVPEIEEAPRPETGDSAANGRGRKKQFAVSTRWEHQMSERGGVGDMHQYFCCCARRLGNMFVLLQSRDGTPLVIAGPCWPFCLGVTTPMIAGISGLLTYFVLFNDKAEVPRIVTYIYLGAAGFVLLALCCVSCRDPGLMERVTDEEAGEGGWFWNEQVGSYRPPGALYCRECGVLIQDYDHLCPWTGTGIGKGNMVFFKIFVVGVNVLCYFTVGLVAYVLLDGLLA
mmetsp:Transcript_9178/g.15394  ORF Transcript_9178/g.15394 Transcript_9178/m.15394 type:complete len:258 (-) Transcript_9178:72-845(-)